ncbi:MAG: hypothetical protein EX285_02495 [Thaumarchaeota archaeon]|nr:hypothetical protein [Nitrososphaerota archaeon]
MQKSRLKLKVIITTFLVMILFIALGTTQQIRITSVLAEEPVNHDDVSVAMKQKKKLTLLVIKNLNAQPIFEFKLKIIDGDIKFIKARGWDRDRVDQSTVTVHTDNQPVKSGGSLKVIVIGKTNSSYEWLVFDKNGNKITRGHIGNVIEVPKISLNELEFILKEYSILDPKSLPLVPLYDKKRDVIWISDIINPGIWKFNPETKDFEFFRHDGESSMKLAMDSKGRVWFTDTKTITFGYIDPDEHVTRTFRPPIEGFMIDLQIDSNDNVWIVIINKSKIIRFDSKNENFKIFDLDEDIHPAAILIDEFERVWFTEIGRGSIGLLDPISNEIVEYQPKDARLVAPASILQESNGKIWIGEHGGTNITRFDPITLTFERYFVQSEYALVSGMIEDRYGNIWYAEHVTDKIAVLDPETALTKLIQIPSAAPLVQWLTIDKQGNIWYADPSNSKIGSITIIEKNTIIN